MDSDDDFDCYVSEDACKQMDEDLDLAIAMSFQMQCDAEMCQKQTKGSEGRNQVLDGKNPLPITDQQWEIIDPNPDIRSLFRQFDNEFFWGTLEMVEVRWSPRMTLCAGVCSYEGRGGLCSVRLSQPLLKFRPRKDLVETLLHEMIHAYLFVASRIRDHDAHGPEFLKHMKRINQKAGTNISVYHNFHDEVDYHRKHWWKCTGPCQNQKPYYGIVKRVMNRAPGPRDPWWAAHQTQCGGTYVKFKEPENFGQTKNKSKEHDQKVRSKDIRSLLTPTKPPNITVKSDNQISNLQDIENKTLVSSTSVIPFSGKGYVLGKVGNSNVSRLLTLSDSSKRHSGSSISSKYSSFITPQSTTTPSVKANSGKRKASPTWGSNKAKFSRSKTSLGSGSKTIVISKSGGVKPNIKNSENLNNTKDNSTTFLDADSANGYNTSWKKPICDPKSIVTVARKQKFLDDYMVGERAKKKKVGIIFNSDDDDEIVELDQKKSENNGNLRHETLVKPVDHSNANNSNDEHLVKCPVCSESIQTTMINNHLDHCLEMASDPF